MQAFYFGPYRTAGHFLSGPGGSYIGSDKEKIVPWRHIDGVLQPNCVFKFMQWDRGQENEGESILHYRNGWTALCMWDRSVDTRGACNSNFFFEGSLSFVGAVEHAKMYFADRIAKMKFEIYESKEKKNALLCPKGENYAVHVPAIVHRAGKVSAEVLNTCGVCGAAIGNWYNQWVELDSWSERAVRDGRPMY
jgi:hypothetical protein